MNKITKSIKNMVLKKQLKITKKGTDLGIKMGLKF